MIEFYLYVAAFVSCVAIVFAFMRTLSTIVHELGHAIPALLFSKGAVKIYIGSHGNPTESSVFKIGRLTIFYKYDLARLNCGLCSFHVADLKVAQYFVIALLGPLLSLLVGSIFCYLSFWVENWFSLKIIFFMYFISSLYDFYINMRPKKHPIELYDGRTIHNDGEQLKLILLEGQKIIDFHKSIELYLLHNYVEAETISKQLIESGYEKEALYRIAELSLIFSNRLEEAKKLINVFKKKYPLISEDYVIIGLWHDQREEYDLAISEYDKAMKLEPSNAMIYNNKGHAYIMKGEYRKALVELEKSLVLDPKLNFATLNKGLALIHLQQLEEGLAIFNKILEEETENAYAIGGIGIYYYLKNDYIAAKNYLNQSLAIDSNTKIVQQYLAKCLASENNRIIRE